MINIEWLPLVWLRTVMIAITLFIVFPRFSLSLKKLASRVKLSQLHVYYGMIVFWEFVTVLIIFYLLKVNNLPLIAIGLNGNLSLTSIAYVIIGAVISGSLYPIVQAFCKLLGWKMFWPRSEDMNWFPKSIEYLSTKRDIVWMFLIVVICIPVLEEIIYRGYIFTALSQNLNNIFLVFILTSLIFASIHCLAGPGFMLFIFLGTFILSFLYWKFGNIYPCILLHSINTLIGEIIIPLLEKQGKV